MTTHEPVCRPSRSLGHAQGDFQEATHLPNCHNLQKQQETPVTCGDHYDGVLQLQTPHTLPAHLLR